jgi:hypothetical protein
MPARAAGELFSAGFRDQDPGGRIKNSLFFSGLWIVRAADDVEPALIHHAISFSAPVAQLDRVPGYEPGGRGFESLRARQ